MVQKPHRRIQKATSVKRSLSTQIGDAWCFGVKRQYQALADCHFRNVLSDLIAVNCLHRKTSRCIFAGRSQWQASLVGMLAGISSTPKNT
jgi:hypothetical protein